jgi:hypothetical protein
MALKLIASLIGAALMVTSAAADDFSYDDYAQSDNQNQGRIVRGSCDRAAQQAVQMTGGELLSVHPARNGRPICAVIVLVINAKGRPRKMRLRIPMDF